MGCDGAIRMARRTVVDTPGSAKGFHYELKSRIGWKWKSCVSS